MAFSAHKCPSKIKEHFADEDIVRQQAQEIADLIRKSKHFVVFTGAGVSTSAGIPDFRGPKGVWTLQDQGKAVEYGVDVVEAVPTPTHMALVKLQQAGLLTFLISQNCDGLHRRSGFPAQFLAELHGNSNLEYCIKCKKEYLRDFDVCRDSNDVHEHETGRKCICGGPLMDTIINFTENLPEKPLKDAFYHSKNSDLFMVLGSSLTVTPACDMPVKAVNNGSNLIICNLQKTSLDDDCKVRVFTKTDLLMALVCESLGLTIPTWKLFRYFSVQPKLLGSKSRSKVYISLSTYDEDQTPATILSNVEFKVKGSSNNASINCDGKNTYSSSQFQFLVGSLPCNFQLTMWFMGHYKEPPITMPLSMQNEHIEQSMKFTFAYDPMQGVWEQINCSL